MKISKNQKSQFFDFFGKFSKFLIFVIFIENPMKNFQIKKFPENARNFVSGPRNLSGFLLCISHIQEQTFFTVTFPKAAT